MINFHKRTLIKGITWEGSGLVTLFLIMYFGIVPNAMVASVWTIIYTVIRVSMYYVHERIWKRTSWGKRPLTEKKDDE